MFFGHNDRHKNTWSLKNVRASVWASPNFDLFAVYISISFSSQLMGDAKKITYH